MEWWEEKGKWFDCFLVLGISEDATEKEIHKAYRDCMKRMHPDSNPNSTCDSSDIARIKCAYDTLKDENKRKKYIEYSKLLKNKSRRKEEKEEENLSFEELLKSYKKREKQIKMSINLMIKNIEDKKSKFTLLYDKFVLSIKNGELNSNEFEIRKQKLRSVLLAGLNSIKEVEENIEKLSSIDFSQELEVLSAISADYKAYDDILTSSYNQACRKLSEKKNKDSKLKKVNSFKIASCLELGIIVSILAVGTYFGISIANENDKVVLEEQDESEEEEEIKVDDENIESSDSDASLVEPDDHFDCILFESVPDDMVYDEMSDPYYYADREVIKARKDGVKYLLDAEDKRVLIANYLSSGPVLIDDETYACVLVFLGIDGRDYTVDISDFRTVLDVKDSYSYESEPFYLEGYGEVIETESHGGKHLIDADTRESLVDLYDEYTKFYSDELGCDTYCFSNEYVKTYVDSKDLTKVLKVEHY